MKWRWEMEERGWELEEKRGRERKWRGYKLEEERVRNGRERNGKLKRREKKVGLKEMKTINKAQAPKHGEMGERGWTKRETGISSTLNITSNTVQQKYLLTPWGILVSPSLPLEYHLPASLSSLPEMGHIHHLNFKNNINTFFQKAMRTWVK